VAGDIDAGTAGVTWAATTFRSLPVIYVAGNHEFYRHEHGQLIGALREAAMATENVRFLDRDEMAFDLRGRSVRVLGCTAWTDYQLYGGPLAREAKERAMALMYDHKRISFGARIFHPDDALELHLQAASWLDARLPQDSAGTTIVVTHHAPAPESVEPRFRGDSLSPAFASDLTSLMHRHRPELWIHGHTHYNVDYAVGSTRVVSHQWGYPNENVARGTRVVEV
jgi:UDP-2,3-diacylglucosamine pyrophosphatase LpxH